MSRSGYEYDCETWDLIRWRGAVTSAVRGKRGQALLRELAAALDAMPRRELIAHELASDGAHCALGVLGSARGLPLGEIDQYEPDELASAFGVSPALAREIVFVNDEWESRATPAQRWELVRTWVRDQIRD